ncbi:unnamed protein product [Citrullus colocynthis]|uniref:Uncharacterized protein n=1 Tax=Citrullus colocynthis TaxID=252529 RepID=A0ABP0Z103_9ROSI
MTVWLGHVPVSRSHWCRKNGLTSKASVASSVSNDEFREKSGEEKLEKNGRKIGGKEWRRRKLTLIRNESGGCRLQGSGAGGAWRQTLQALSATGFDRFGINCPMLVHGLLEDKPNIDVGWAAI